MKTVHIQLTARDPLVSRDGRPFGLNQGQRMRGLPWLLPSVVAGSLRTALVKGDPQLDFSNDMPQRLLALSVAGVFPVVGKQIYLPVPADAVAEPSEDGRGIKTVHRVKPQEVANGGCDFPYNAALQPVMLDIEQSKSDFKPAAIPAWWPVSEFAKWMTCKKIDLSCHFLNHPNQETRDHVCIESATGAAEESKLFATTGLALSSLPRYRTNHFIGVAEKRDNEAIQLAVRVRSNQDDFDHLDQMNLWHPLGGERRMALWQSMSQDTHWACPEEVQQSLTNAVNVRMAIVTPAVFGSGWKPGWLNDQLEGTPPGSNTLLKLVAVCNGRWKAISGWSLQKINHRGTLDSNGQPGPKPIRRMVPAGSVYFFKTIGGNAGSLAARWLEPVSDDPQESRDGFGLAAWGTW